MSSPQCTTFLSPNGLADRWGVARRTIYEMLQDGRLAHMRVGRAVRIPLSTIEDHERRSTCASSSTPVGPTTTSPGPRTERRNAFRRERQIGKMLKRSSGTSYLLRQSPLLTA